MLGATARIRERRQPQIWHHERQRRFWEAGAPAWRPAKEKGSAVSPCKPSSQRTGRENAAPVPFHRIDLPNDSPPTSAPTSSVNTCAHDIVLWSQLCHIYRHPSHALSCIPRFRSWFHERSSLPLICSIRCTPCSGNLMGFCAGLPLIDR